MTKKKGTESGVLAAFEGTLLADIFRIMESGASFSPIDEEIKKGETVIGELTLFEKALLTFCNNLADEATVLAVAIKADELNRKSPGAAPDKLAERDFAFAVKAELYQGTSAVFWANLKSRIGAPALGDGGIGIRKGYRVVRIPVEIKHVFILTSVTGEDRPPTIANILGGAGSGPRRDC